MTAPNSLAVELNTLNSSVIAGYEKVITDNIFKKNPTLHFLLKNKKMYDGGAVITEPLIYSTMQAQEYSGAKVLDVNDVDPVTRLTLDPSYHTLPIVMTDTDDLENNGKAKVFDILETKYSIADMSMREWLSTSLFRADSTGYKMWSIREIVKTTVGSNPSRGAYGNISVATETWFRNQASEDIAATTGALVFANLQTLWGNCVNGGGDQTNVPDWSITTQAIYNRLWSIADLRQQLGNEYVKLNIGVPSIDFNGCPIMVDQNAPALQLRFLNSKSLFLKVHSRSNFVFTEWVTPTNQHLAVKHFKFAGQLVCNEKRGMGVLTITA